MTLTVELIQAARDGDRDAVDRLFSLAYGELKELAHLIRGRDGAQTLNTTALVHEAYLKLRPERGLDLDDRAHFTHIVARAMRQVVIDEARRRSADKRGGGDVAVTLDESLWQGPVRAEELLKLDDAMTEQQGGEDDRPPF